MVTIYTQPTCGKCKVLKSKLDAAGIKYQENSDIQKMISRGFTSTPMLEVDGVVRSFRAALDWVESEGNK